MEQVAVVLVNMPFGPHRTPALGISLLKPALVEAGISATVRYLALDFAREIGLELYDRIANSSQAALVGEWLFSHALFARSATQVKAYRRECLVRESAQFRRELAGVREKTVPFLERAVREIASFGPRIVGFTSTFQQHVASLALAQRLKAGNDALTILFGGANCEAVMGAETLRQFAFVDATISGEADLVVVELVRRILEGAPFDELQGVYTATNLERVAARGYPAAPKVETMDALPYPDFSDFFEQARATFELGDLKPGLLFETSRGCWWGEKHHCTFCGLNGTTMSYRSKSAQRALDELRFLAQSYPTRRIGAVDNILDMRYFDDFVPGIKACGLDLDIHYEVKANLKKPQLRALKDAGIRRLQPGVESLSTRVLQEMKKGVSGLQNVQLLKWCKELGIRASWSWLWGFPSEDPSEYGRMAKLVPLVSHLQPPIADERIRLDRFSPNFDFAQTYGLMNLRPAPGYAYIYDVEEPALNNLAYYFQYDYARRRDVKAYTAALAKNIARWRKAFEASELISIDLDDALLIADTRWKSLDVRFLDEVDRLLYLECDGICAGRRLLAVGQERGYRLTASELAKRLGRLVRAGLMLRERDAYLSLAIPLGEYSPNELLHSRLLQVARAGTFATLALSS